MEFKLASLQTCAEATGIVAVIDVIRAFTAAAFAFAAGAKTITLASTVDQALKLRDQQPRALVMGEDRGLRPPQFDLGNSPHELSGIDLSGRPMIQRTSRGTQGVIASKKADKLLASSFCCAQATAEYISSLSPELVTFVATGIGPHGEGDEDIACAEYLEALLRGYKPKPEKYLQRVQECRTSQTLFGDPRKPGFHWEDIECCASLDKFHFSMIIERQNGLFVMKPIVLDTVADNFSDTK